MDKILATVIVPAYNREETIERAIASIVGEGLPDHWEIIVIDDASTDGTRERVKKWTQKYPKNIILVPFQDHSERVNATNSGIALARGEWVIRLDSDDAFVPHFKRAFADAIKLSPNAKILNWGSLVHWRKDDLYHKTDVRQPFKVELDDFGNVKPFKSGGICSGGFGFRKSLIWQVGFLPSAKDPYTFGKKMKGEYPELQDLYGDKDDLGNPYGDDLALYYKLTRVAVPVTLDEILHSQHVR